MGEVSTIGLDISKSHAAQLQSPGNRDQPEICDAVRLGNAMYTPANKSFGALSVIEISASYVAYPCWPPMSRNVLKRAFCSSLSMS
jgi:hypothetical protein